MIEDDPHEVVYYVSFEGKHFVEYDGRFLVAYRELVSHCQVKPHDDLQHVLPRDFLPDVSNDLLLHVLQQTQLELSESVELEHTVLDTVTDLSVLFEVACHLIHEGECFPHHLLHSFEPHQRAGQVRENEERHCAFVSGQNLYFLEESLWILDEEIEGASDLAI